jgi:4-fold beta flower protein
MKLIPLIDRAGNVKAWADPRSGWITDLAGNAFWFVSFDGFFTRRGAQVGWWHGDHIRDRYGRVVLSRPDAQIEVIKIPSPKRLPQPPKMHLPPSHPVLTWLPPPLLKKHQWADFYSLHEGLEQLRAYEERSRLSPKGIEN